MRNNINTYADLTAYNADTKKDYPNVSYIVEDDIVLFDKINYAQQYFTIESLEDNNEIMFKLKVWTTSASPAAKTISVSTDGGKTWTNYTSTTGGTTIATLNKGEKILIKGNNNNYYDGCYNHFTANKKFDVNGNIMSLIYGDDFKEQYSFPTGTRHNFDFIFDSAPVVSAENLILPATTLAEGCYSVMFNGCTSLTTAPELPAKSLGSYCYNAMFLNCTSLITAPELPATTLARNCYDGMFSGCTSLTTAPELPAKSLASYCYQSMFGDCTSLTTAPELPATTLKSSCYSGMFSGCTSLVTAPELPAKSLAQECYQSMFYGCTSLTTAPELPAKSLESSCYSYMFQNCSNLNYIKAMFTTTPNYDYTGSWVVGVASSGTFVKNSAATWDVRGKSGVPTGWTVVTE